MRKEDLKRQVADRQFIEGVYNYCDRWCERCPLTSSCLNFAMGQEEDRRNPKSKDPENQEFWDRIHESFQAAMELLVESAAEHGIDLNNLDVPDEDGESDHDRAEKHPLAENAKQYARAVDRWFKENEAAFQAKEMELEKLARLELPGHHPDQTAMGIADEVEIIRWYQYFINAKTVRALSGRARSDELADTYDFPKDSDGSAKVALIAIDRSIAAWAGLMGHFPDLEESVLLLLVQLERLRRALEAEFPGARGFQRPGFDAGWRAGTSNIQRPTSNIERGGAG